MEFPTTKKTEKPKKEIEGCEIKFKRDPQGRVIGVKTQGCSKAEIEAFMNQRREIEVGD